VVLKFGIIRKSATAAEVLLEGTSNPFVLQSGVTGPVTNISILSKDSPYSLKDVDVTGAAEELLSQILYTGNLPSGTYQFWVKLLSQDETTVLAQDYEENYFGNPGGNLVLMSPGQNATYPEIVEIYTSQPIFQWQSNSLLFEIFLYEEEVHNHGNPQMVINNEVYAQYRIDDPNTSVANLNSSGYVTVAQMGTTPAIYLFQLTYPTAARQLKPDYNYYWLVNVLDGNGNLLMQSEIWRFKYVDPSQRGASVVENQQVLSLLRSLLGDAKFEELFINEGGAFINYNFSGEMYNGERLMDFNDLHQFYLKFLTGQITLVAPTAE
jgi:hypothetical protein